MMDPKKENIFEHLKNSGPGFSVPKGYFNEDDDSLNASLNPNQNKQQEDSDPLISLLGEKESGFKVPKGYFQEVESSILTSQKTKVIPFKMSLLRVGSLAVAASILLFFGINYMNSDTSMKEQMVFQDEEFSAWIESDLIDFDTYEIAEAFNDVELEYDLYADEDIDDYLNNVDIENLILENR